MARKIEVEIVGDASHFNRTADSAVQKGKSFGGAMKGVGLGLGLGAFNLAAGALGSFVGALGDAQQAYRDDQVSQTNLRTALKNTIPAWDGSTKAVEKYASAQGALGFQDDEIRASIGQLVGITHDQTKAMELNSLAQDLARAKGIDLATATDIVTKAAQGSGKALKGLGIDTGGATDAASLLDGIQKNVKGSAEAWVATAEGKQAVANVKMSEAWEKIGSVVNKVATAVLPLVAGALTWVADVIGKLSPVISVLVAYVQNFWIPIFKGVIDIASNIIGALGNVISFVVNMPSRIGGALSGMWNGLWVGFKSVINSIIGAWNGLSFTVPKITVGPVSFGGFTLGTPNIPYLHSGGIVPGVPGSDVLTMLQAGERVIPNGGGGGGVVINIASFTGSDRDIDRFADRLALRMRLQGV